MIYSVKALAQKGDLSKVKAFLDSIQINDKKELKQTYHIFFIEACRYGYMDILKFIIEKDKNIMHNKNAEGFKIACACGELDVVKFLLTDKSLKRNIDVNVDNDAGFRWACEYNQLEVVKYLLTSTELNVHADIHVNEDFGFIKASEDGFLEIVEYLLTSKDLKPKANLNARDDYAFRFACMNEHKDVVKFLLKVSNESENKINVKSKDFQVLKQLIKGNKYDMLNYLILELDLFDISEVKNIVKNNTQALEIFNKRELNRNLHANLNKKEISAKVNKI